jgi:tetratricopeptide (TPR) repeat protein
MNSPRKGGRGRWADQTPLKSKSKTQAKPLAPGALPDAPPSIEAESRDLSTFEPLLGGREPGATEALIANLKDKFPLLEELLGAQSLKEQKVIIEQKLSKDGYEPYIMTLSVIEFNYQIKDKRLEEALMIAKLQRQIALMMPEDWKPSNHIGHTRARHLADALNSIGSIYLDLGETGKALDYFKQSEEHFERDAEERQEHGLTELSQYDQLFLGRNPRALLYEKMARLYHELKDEASSLSYRKRMGELDRQHHSTEIQIKRWLGSGRAAEEAGDFDQALNSYQSALDMALEDPNSQIVSRNIVTACHHIGSLLHRLKLFRQALKYQSRALEMNQHAGHLERMNYDHRAIGLIFEARPDLGDALEHYEAALACVSTEAASDSPFRWRASDGKLYRVFDPDLAWFSAMGMARALIMHQDYERADALLQLAISLGEVMRAKVLQDEYRIGLHANRLEAYERIVSMHAQLAADARAQGEPEQGHAALAWKYMEHARGRNFLDLLGSSDLRLPREIPVELQAQESSLLEELRSLRRAYTENKAQSLRVIWDDYEAAQGKLNDLWQQMSVSPDAAAYVELRRGQPIAINTLRSLLRQ